MSVRISFRRVSSLAVLLAIGLLICSACQKEDAEEKNKKIHSDVVEKLEIDDEEPAVKAAETPPAPLTIPAVELTEKDAADCLVKVGDAMPNAALVDLQGKPVELRSLYGKKLSVVCFWNGEQTAGLQAIQELDKYVAEPYAGKGVAVIGINVGDAAPVAKEKAALAEAKFTMLLDPESAYFKKVAAATLPRVYLLAADGKVLWFDIDYSRSMRRDLVQGITVALKEQP